VAKLLEFRRVVLRSFFGTVHVSIFGAGGSVVAGPNPRAVKRPGVPFGFFWRFTNSRRQFTENFMRTGGETANRSGRRGECQGYRIKSSPGDPFPDRRRSRSIFRDCKLCHGALC